MFSITSISPHCGQPTLLTSSPSNQNAGQIPFPSGSFIRASKRPYLCENFPFDLIRPEVYHLAIPSLPVKRSFKAVMTRFPSLRSTFFSLDVYVSNSSFPNPPPPRSNPHFAGSGLVPSAPLNSSLHVSLHPLSGMFAGAAERQVKHNIVVATEARTHRNL